MLNHIAFGTITGRMHGFLPEMLSDLARLHFIQKLPQILTGGTACIVWVGGLCKPAYDEYTIRGSC